MQSGLKKTLCTVLPLAGLLFFPPLVSAHDKDHHKYHHELKRVHREFHRDLERSHREFHRALKRARRDYYRGPYDDCERNRYPYSYQRRSRDYGYYPPWPFYSGSPWWDYRWWDR